MAYRMVGVLVVLALTCGVVSGDAAKKEADKLTTEILRGTRTQAEAAKKMLEAARMLGDVPGVQMHVAIKACECGMAAPAGYDTSLAALDLLDKVQPGNASDWRDMRVEVYRLRYSRGDRMARLKNGRKYVELLLSQGKDLSEKNKWPEAAKVYRQAHGVARSLNLPESAAIFELQRRADNRARIATRLAYLKTALEKTPGDTVTRRSLVELYLIDLDMPAEAARYVNDTLNVTLRTNTLLAAQEASELADADFVTLGRWYRTLAARTTAKEAKARLLTRAVTHLKMYLEVYTKKDVQRLRVTTELKEIETLLKGLGPVAPSKEPEWVDALAMVDPARHRALGEASRVGRDILLSGSREAAVTVPITALGSYDLDCAFTLKSGSFAKLILPVGIRYVGLSIGAYYGRVAGLSMVDGKSADRGNPTTIKLTERGKTFLKVGARTTLSVAVRIKDADAQVTVTMNGKKLLAWSGKQTQLSLGDSWPILGRQFALATYRSKVQWHAVKLRRLNLNDRTLVCVSRKATYKPSSVYRSYPPLPAFVTGAGKLHRDGMAFQTARQADPYVIVTLGKIEMVKRIILDNKRGYYAKYNTGIVISVSTDGRRWSEAWRARGVQRCWIIDLKMPLRARYIRVARPSKSTTYLGLGGIAVYAQP